MAKNITDTDKFVSTKAEKFYLAISQLNAQLGIFDAIVLEKGLKLRKEETYYKLKEQMSTSNLDDDSNKQDPNRENTLKGSEIFEWMANRLTRIIYTLYDMGLVLGKNTLSHSESRINREEIEWLINLQGAIKLRDINEPVLPIGDHSATQCYLAVVLCQQALFQLKELTIEEEYAAIYIEYLCNLEKLLILFARLSNNRDWTWRPYSETKEE